MIKLKYLTLLILLSLSSYVSAQSNKDLAIAKGREAVKLIDNGRLDESIVLLNEAQALDPESMIYPYELAYAYYHKAEYKKSIPWNSSISLNLDMISE